MTALVVAMLPVYVLAFALVVDLAHLFWVRAALQSAADLAALAGAQEVDLEALAGGERRLLEAQAAAAARAWAERNLRAHPATEPLLAQTAVEVAVVQASDREPSRHPWTGRRLEDPTVTVRLTAEVPRLWLPGRGGGVRLRVWADASVKFRR